MMPLTWLKVFDYGKWLTEAIGVPAVVIIIVLLGHGYFTNKTVQAHAEQTRDILNDMRNEQLLHNARVINYLRAICFNTAAYDKGLMRECGKI